MARWYDKYPKLQKRLDSFKTMPSNKRDILIKGIMKIVKDNNAGFIMEDFIMEFPLDISRKRWYDKDPYLWIIFNGLKYADKKLLDIVTEYLIENVDLQD